jgi:flagellar biogenesis protein FliO
MVLALVSVLMLLATARWILLRKGLGNMGNTRGADGLVLAATLPLDPRTRLVVVRRGAAELVLAVGAHGVSALEFPGGPQLPGQGGGAAQS